MRQVVDNAGAKPAVIQLKQAIFDIRQAQAEKADREMRFTDSARIRLSLLADELRSVIDALPGDDGFFLCRLAEQGKPRYWVDIVTFVEMNVEGSGYRCIKDTRMGRQLLHESADKAEMAEFITNHIATIIVYRHQVIEDNVDYRHQGRPQSPAGHTRTSIDVSSSFDGQIAIGLYLLFATAIFLSGLFYFFPFG